MKTENNFVKKTKTDKVFLLSMIDDPIKTLVAYNLKCKDDALERLNKVAENVRERAIGAFTEELATSGTNMPENACNNC